MGINAVEKNKAGWVEVEEWLQGSKGRTERDRDRDRDRERDRGGTVFPYWSRSILSDDYITIEHLHYL